MPTIFDHDVRILACEGCGAPLEAAITGGVFPCRFCGAANHVAVRDEAIHPAAPEPEPERVARLRQQDGRPLLPPPGITSLRRISRTSCGSAPMDAACEVLRANAWERLGQAPRAVEQLREYMAAAGAGARAAVAKVRDTYPAWQLCAQSFPAAQAAHRAAAGEHAATALMEGALAPGATVPVRVDPNNLTEVQLELD